MIDDYLIHSIDFCQKINLNYELSTDLLLFCVCISITTRSGALRAASGQRPDIVAKDLTGSRVILMLYFTIFLNQLDNLCPYTPNGTNRSTPG
jgi:hypothetical protein